MTHTTRFFSSRWASQWGLDNPQWTRFLKKWLLLSLALHLVAGVMSIGFYDMDEHFQIMEFVSYKLGHSPASALPHEFFENCRSWFQPSLYEGIARFWRALGALSPTFKSPSFWAANFRVFSALLGWFGLVSMSICCYGWFPQRHYRELVVKLAALLYFLPYLHARTSSENLGGSFFVLGVAALVLSLKSETPADVMKNQPISTISEDSAKNSMEAKASPEPLAEQYSPSLPVFGAFGAGVLLGFSFLSRFQMGFMLFGLGAWCLLIARIRFKSLIVVFLGILASIGLGLFLDWRATGVWTLSPYNYFFSYQKASASPNVGIFPWWGYFDFLLGDVPLLGNLIAAGVITAWCTRPKSPLTWATVPFVLFHMAIAHKEPRYLFPLISTLPILLTFGLEAFDSLFLKRPKPRVFHWAKSGVIFLNMGGLAIATLKPAAIQPMLHSYIFDHQSEIHEVQYIDNNPFELTGLALNFYRPDHLAVVQTSYAQLAKDLQTTQQPRWLYYPQLQLPPEAESLQQRCQLKYTVFPNWLRKFLFLPGLRISNKASLYQCS